MICGTESGILITIFFFTIKFTISIAKRDIIIATNNPPLPILINGIPLLKELPVKMPKLLILYWKFRLIYSIEPIYMKY